jgi:hypothetical protein
MKVSQMMLALTTVSEQEAYPQLLAMSPSFPLQLVVEI